MTVVSSPAIRHRVFCPTLPDPNEIEDELREAFRTGTVTAGPHVAELEKAVCERTGAKRTVAVSCGTSALMLIMRALGLPQGSEVITPSFTFAATAQALLWYGCKPVFCDCDPNTFTMDPVAAESLITERTSAIYPVCVFGVAGDLDAYQQIVDRHPRLKLLFDTAQGLGSTYKGKGLGSFGQAEAFSMSPTKVVTALEGGLITTNDDEMADQLRQMRDYGKSSKVDGDMEWLGLSARMGEVNAMVAKWSLARLDQWIAHRTAVMDRYRERLDGIPGISFQDIPSDRTSSRNYMVILLDPEVSPIKRDALYERLKEDGIQTKRYFYPALHDQTVFRDVEPGCGARLQVSERISARSLALPLYSHIRMDDVDEICDRVLRHASA